MQVKLVRQRFDGSTSYKIKSMEWCCASLKDNPLVSLSDEYCGTEEDDGDDAEAIPAATLRRVQTVGSYGDEWEQETYYKINFCPFCGEPVHVRIDSEEDVTEQFNSITRQRERLWAKCVQTDSKKKERELMEQVRGLDRKIEWFYSLADYTPPEGTPA